MISPDFIPHKHFHKGSWLIEKDNPDWYYFYPNRINQFNYNDKYVYTLEYISVLKYNFTYEELQNKLHEELLAIKNSI